MKKYAILFFQQINDVYSKWVFPLHEGENIIGSDSTVDIFLLLDEKEDIIDSVHAKIILKEQNQLETDIISLATKGCVKKGEDENQFILWPGKEYKLCHKNVFFLTDNIKFMLVKGTVNEIHKFLLSENLEDEYQKWLQKVIDLEKNTKLSLNLSRKESSILNKSIISNENYANSINNSASKNNVGLFNNNFGTSANNGSNLGYKDLNRINFNNFDEVQDNILNDYKYSKQISGNGFNSRNNFVKSNSINLNTSPFTFNNGIIQNNINNKEQKKEEYEIDNNSNINKQKNSKIINDSFDLNNTNLFNDNNSEQKKRYKELPFFNDEKSENKLKELFGECDLEKIIQNTNFSNIIDYDNYFGKYEKKRNSRGEISLNNFGFQIK